jgi:hypothetical protein
MVAVDADGYTADEGLAAFFGGVCFLGEEDQAGAGSPCWFLLDFDKVTEWFKEA